MKDSKCKRQLIKIEKASGLSETYSEPSEISMIELSSKIVDCIQPITIFANTSYYVFHRVMNMPLITLNKILVRCHLFHNKVRSAISANFFHF